MVMSEKCSICEMLNALECGAVLLDKQAVVMYANPKFSKMIEVDQAELVGSDLTGYYVGEQDKALVRKELSLNEPTTVEREFFLPRRDGTELPVLSMGKPISIDGKEMRLVTMMDITSQKQIHHQVANLSDTIMEQALALKENNESLEQRVSQSTAELRQANLDAIYMLAVASEAKDESTGKHVMRIQELAEMLALAIGISAKEASTIGYSAILHDIGKIHVPDHILKKPGKLDSEEYRIIQVHTISGQTILADRPFFKMARQIARSHHENWDGSGYPDGLHGENIPLSARIVHLVDVFDALIHPRVYKEAWSMDATFEEIRKCSGSLFEPRMVVAFEGLHAEGKLNEKLDKLGVVRC